MFLGLSALGFAYLAIGLTYIIIFSRSKGPSISALVISKEVNSCIKSLYFTPSRDLDPDFLRSVFSACTAAR